MQQSLIRSLVIFILSLPYFAHAQVPNKGLLFEVSGKGLKKPSYLFGTFHLLKSDYLKEIPKLEDCFNSAKGVVVEVDIKPEDMILVSAAMVMKDKKLTDFLTKDEQDALNNKLIEATGMGLTMYNTLKPSAVVASLSTQLPPEAKEKVDRYDGSLMDMYFMQKAHAENKPVTGLETAAEQAQILFGDSLNKQIDWLKKYIAQIDESDTITSHLVDYYFSQNLAEMYNLSMKYNEGFAAGDMNTLLFNRNKNWMKVLPALFKKEPQFVAVGALHLAGEEGLVNQLRKLGYTVKMVE